MEEPSVEFYIYPENGILQMSLLDDDFSFGIFPQNGYIISEKGYQIGSDFLSVDSIIEDRWNEEEEGEFEIRASVYKAENNENFAHTIKQLKSTNVFLVETFLYHLRNNASKEYSLVFGDLANGSPDNSVAINPNFKALRLAVLLNRIYEPNHISLVLQEIL